MKLDDIINKIKIEGEESYRLNTPNDFHFPVAIIKALKDNFDPKFEKGGLIRFSYRLVNGNLIFEAKDVVFVTNRSENPKGEYSPDKGELATAYDIAFTENLLPLAFHTHPTINSESDNIINEGMNYLHQLNTSIADKGYTLRTGYIYKETKLRFPDILVVENANALFIGVYGGLVAPMCFTEQKEKASQEAMEKVFEGVKNWANTPERQGALILTACVLVILGVRYYKVGIPAVIAASIIVPPMLYANQDRNDFFGVSYGMQLIIHIPKIGDEEIIEYEKKAIAARKEAIKRAEEKRKK